MGTDVLSLIIFLGCIILFILDKLPMATTAILGCVVMVLFGVCDFKTAFGSFSSSTVILTIGVMVIGAAVSETGLAERLGAWITRKSKGSETTLLIGTYLASSVLSSFLTNSAVLAIFIPIIYGLSKSNSSISAKNLIMPIAYGCTLGGASTLVGSTQQMTALLCIITGCITQKKAIVSVNWNIVGRLAGCLGLAAALEAAGGTALITEGFKNLVGDRVSPFLLFCIFVFLVQFTSEFISNSTAILIVLPIIIAVAPVLGLNTYAFALGTTIASGTVLSCPLAGSTLGMSMVVGYKFNDYFKYSILFDIISYITIIVTVPVFYGLTA